MKSHKKLHALRAVALYNQHNVFLFKGIGSRNSKRLRCGTPGASGMSATNRRIKESGITLTDSFYFASVNRINKSRNRLGIELLSPEEKKDILYRVTLSGSAV